MSSEPFFLVDEELVELENILKDLDFRLKNPDLEKNNMILNAFVKSCIKASKKPPKPAFIEKEIKQELPKIKEIKQVPVKKRVFPVPAPKGGKIETFKTKTKFKKQLEEKELPISQIPLIQDNVTKKLVALADINDKYVVREPPVSGQEIQILKQIIEQKPEDPKQAWKFLNSIAPDLTDEQKTNIKYYIINSLFALGRLEPLLHDEKITDIACDGVGAYITIKRDNQLLKTNIIFKDKDDLDSYLKKLAKRFDKALDEANPIIDIVHRGYRFHIILGLYGASSKFIIKKIE